VKTNINNYMNSEAACVPTIVDIDGDGDLDFLTGSAIGQVTYYQNTGTAANFIYTFVTDFFPEGHGINIQGGADHSLHGASSIVFGDIDGDNDKDLFWGDLFGLSIYFIKNTGTSQNFQWNFIDTTSPEPNPYYSGGFNMPGVYDIDGDNKNDFFIGVLIGSKTIDNFVFYKNQGPVNNPVFTKITDNFILSADIGSYSYPAFADIDNDGDKDLFVGCDKSVGFFRNTGTATQPAFTLENDSLPLNINNFNYAPAVGDLDGDGKKDMVVGFYALAKLRFFKNTGTLTNPVFTYTPSQLDTMNLSQASAPCLADLDNDGDLDILVGNSSGRLTYYKNNGTTTIFNYQFISNNYMSVNVGNDAVPSLGDLDGDGDLDLLVGNRLGAIAFFRNTGTISNPTFTLVTTTYAGINAFQNTVPAIVDLNSDTDPDLFLGNVKGGLYYYENWDVFGIQQIGTEIPGEFSLYQNIPNPFNPSTKIKFDVSAVNSISKVSLIVYNVLGKEVKVLVNQNLKPGKYEADWNAASNPSGVYFYRLSYDGFSAVKKMVLVK
ncbi:MAG: T9SS type A sorting domain-containing protein, partial [Ignavibacteria bacterium]